MKASTTLFTIATATLLAASCETSSAVECTAVQILDNDLADLDVVWEIECPGYDFKTSPVAKMCANTKCLATIKEVVAQYEDCSVAGKNIKKLKQQEIASCSDSTSGNTTTSAPASTAKPNSSNKTASRWSTNSTSTPAPTSSTSATACTAEQLVTNEKARLTIANAKECAKLSSQTTTQACADTKCIEVIKKVVTQFEDCTTLGMNVKQTLIDTVASCAGSMTSTATSTKTSLVAIALTSVLAAFATRM